MAHVIYCYDDHGIIRSGAFAECADDALALAVALTQLKGGDAPRRGRAGNRRLVHPVANENIPLRCTLAVGPPKAKLQTMTKAAAPRVLGASDRAHPCAIVEDARPARANIDPPHTGRQAPEPAG